MRTQARLRKLPRASRRSRGSRDQAPRSASLSCPHVDSLAPLVSPCGSRRRGIYPERPCAPVFVWFVVNPADTSSLADFLLNTEH